MLDKDDVDKEFQRGFGLSMDEPSASEHWSPVTAAIECMVDALAAPGVSERSDRALITPVRFVGSATGRRMRTLIQVNARCRQINEASFPCGKL
ncbi:MAG: hypothetical protein ACXU9A_03810 [Xanthobacteraceae bacterium]